MKHREQQGFTLIEILLYIAIVSGFLVAASTFTWNIINSKTKAQALQEVEMNGKIILEHLTQAIRSARDIDALSLLDANLANPGNAGEMLSLDIRNAVDDPIEIDVLNGVMRYRQGATGPLAISSNLVTITDLTFTDYQLPSGKSQNLGITLTIEYINPENKVERDASVTYTTTVEIRDRPR